MSVVIVIVVALVVAVRGHGRVAVVPHDRAGRGRARPEAVLVQEAARPTTPSRSTARPATRPSCSRPGLRFKLWPVFGVKKFPWVQVPAGEIGVVIAQVGAPLPIGAKSASYKPEFENFSAARDVHRRRRAKGCAAAGAHAGHVVADPSRRVHGRDVAQGLRAARVARHLGAGAARRAACCGPSRSGSRPSSCRSS